MQYRDAPSSPVAVVATALLAALLLAGCALYRSRVRTAPLRDGPTTDEIGAALANAGRPIERCVAGHRSGVLRASVLFAPPGIVSWAHVRNWDPPTDTVEARECVLQVLHQVRVSPFAGKELYVDVSYDLW